MERKLSGRDVDLLFIDGDHTEAGVRSDFEFYRDLVRRGGLIAFHDIVDGRAQEFVEDRDQGGYGIGVLRR